MRTSRTAPAPWAAVLALLTLWAAPAAAEDEPKPAFEPPPVVTASAVLDPEVLEGEEHTVREAVTLYRFLCRYQMESEFGVYDVTSTRLLEIRVKEVTTLARVVHMEGGPEFFKSLGRSLASLPTAAAEFVLDPIDAFQKVGAGLEKTGRRIRDLIRGRRRSAYEESSAANAFHGDEKRQIAAALDLDVYSTNPQVQRFLHEMASARAAGNLTVDLASFALPAVGFALVTTVKWRADVKRLLRDKTPAELGRHNARALRDLGVAQADRNRFLNLPTLSPRHKTVITAALGQMPGVTGLERHAAPPRRHLRADQRRDLQGQDREPARPEGEVDQRFPRHAAPGLRDGQGAGARRHRVVRGGRAAARGLRFSGGRGETRRIACAARRLV